jgi:hypothetical protein
MLDPMGLAELISATTLNAGEAGTMTAQLRVGNPGAKEAASKMAKEAMLSEPSPLGGTWRI